MRFLARLSIRFLVRLSIRFLVRLSIRFLVRLSRCLAQALARFLRIECGNSDVCPQKPFLLAVDSSVSYDGDSP